MQSQTDESHAIQMVKTNSVDEMMLVEQLSTDEHFISAADMLRVTSAPVALPVSQEEIDQWLQMMVEDICSHEKSIASPRSLNFTFLRETRPNLVAELTDRLAEHQIDSLFQDAKSIASKIKRLNSTMEHRTMIYAPLDEEIKVPDEIDEHEIGQFLRGFILKEIGWEFNQNIYDREGLTTLECEGCNTKIKRNDTDKCIQYHCSALKKSVYFHDVLCVNFRRLKESVRWMAAKEEIEKMIGAGQLDPDFEDAVDWHEDISYITVLIQVLGKRRISMRAINVPRPRASMGEFDVEEPDLRRADDEHDPLFAARSSTARYRVGSNIPPKLTATASNLAVDSEMIQLQRLFIEFLDQHNFGLWYRRSRHGGLLHLEQFDEDFDEEKERSKKVVSSPEFLAVVDDFPVELRYLNSFIYGHSMWIFCVATLASKQRDSVWQVLRYIGMQLPSPLAVSLVKKSGSELTKFQMTSLDEVGLDIIETARFPMATALVLAAFMKSRALTDLSRKDDFLQSAKRYIDIAKFLVDQIESDHLLAIYLEIPTDIRNQTIFDIAETKRLIDFLDHNRFTLISEQLWSRTHYLKPDLPFLTHETSYLHHLYRFVRHPCEYYFSPSGLYELTEFLYFTYLGLVTALTVTKFYPFDRLDQNPLELPVWIMSGGYVSAEVREFIERRLDYFSSLENYWDFLISGVWTVLFVLRIMSLLTPTKHLFGNFHPQTSRNVNLTTAFIVLWAIQCFLLWSRMSTYLARTYTFGPLIRMMRSMIADVAIFFVLAIFFFIGVVLAFHYTIAGDLGTNPVDGSTGSGTGYLNRFMGAAQYTFQILLSQQSWTDVDTNCVPNDNGACFGHGRSNVAKIYIVFFALLGNILLLNLLIAIMATTYSDVQQRAIQEVNFQRIKLTLDIEFSTQAAPAPLNVVALPISLMIQLIDLIIYVVTGRTKVINPSLMIPLDIVYDPHDHPKQMWTNVARRLEHDEEFGDQVHCMHCKYCLVDTSGDIERYFSLFKSYHFDVSDTTMMKKLLKDRCGICPRCYRVYDHDSDGASHRLTRHDLIYEVASFYAFILVIYLPLMIALIIPLCVFIVVNRTCSVRYQNQMEKQAIEQLTAGHHGEMRFHVREKKAVAVEDIGSGKSKPKEAGDAVVSDTSRLEQKLDTLMALVRDQQNQISELRAKLG